MAFTAQQSFTLNSGTTPALSNSAAATVTFGYSGNNTPIRYGYLLVQNGATFTVFVRTDGTAASNAGGDFNFEIPAGTDLLVANEQPLWFQSASVIAAGTDIASPLAAGKPGWPGTPASPNIYGASLYGGTTNPGTSISVIAISGSTPTATTDVTITGTG